MSSYWGACTGLALMLTEEEVNDFYKSYLSKTYYPDDAKDHIEELENLIGEYSYQEVAFIKPAYVKELMSTGLSTLEDCCDIDAQFDVNGKIFHMDLYNPTDMCSGGLFFPIEKDERCGDDDCFTLTSTKNKYLFYSSKSIMPWNILSGESYTSIDDIINEYKDKLAAYLPDDFNWKTHIGFIQYAIYA